MNLDFLNDMIPQNTGFKFDTNTIMLMLGILLIAVMAAFFYLKKKNQKKVQVTKTNSGKWVSTMHNLYSSIPLLKKYYSKIYQSVMQNYPAGAFAIKKRTVETVTKGFSAFVVAIIAVCIMARGDLLFLLTGFLTSFILMINLINGRLAKLENQLLYQFQEFLEIMRYHYNESGKVDESLERAMEQSKSEINLHMDQVLEVITDVDIDTAVEEYTAKPTNKFFLLFCSICATITKQGDRPLPEGVTVFLNSVKHLQNELNIEILKKMMIKSAFSMVSIFCLVPVFLMKPIEIAFTNSQKDIAKYYNGAYGTAVMFMVFFVTLIGNMMIESLKDGKLSENKALWQKIADLPLIRQFINKKIKTNFSKSQKIKNSLKRVGSPLTVQTFYAKKIASAFGTMVLFTVIVLSMNFREKQSLLHDFEDVFTSDYAIDEAYIDDLKEFAEFQVSLNIREHGLTQEEISQNILDDLVSKGLMSKAAEAKTVSDAIAQRVTDYHNVYYHFYYVLIMYALGVFGFMIPDILLKSRQKAMEMEMEDEIIQFQSIALIMMHIKESTVEEILIWMEKFSKCFRSSITTCIMNLDSGEKEALEELKENETAPQFHKIINSLINVDKVGVEAAFDSLETEKKFLTEKRARDNEEMISSKSKKAWAIVFVILFAVVGLWIIAPMLMMSTSMQAQITNILG